MNLFSKRPLALLSLFSILGSVFTHTVRRSGASPLWVLLPFLLFFALSLLFLLKKEGRRFLPLFLALALLLGYGTQSMYDALRHAPWRREDAGSLCTLLAEVVELEDRNEAEAVYLIKVEAIDEKAVNIRLLLKTDATCEPLACGDRIKTAVAITDHGNEQLYSEGIAGNAEAQDAPERLSSEMRKGRRPLSVLRDILSERIATGTSKAGAAFYSALLLGDRSALSGQTLLSFRRSGTMHLLALSGMHLTVLALLLLRLLRFLRAPHPLRFLFLLLFLFAYAAIAGFPLSLLRASLMLTVYELGRLLRLLSDSVTSLFLSVALIVLFSPGAALDVGLCLSFLATLGILIATELHPNTKPKRKIAGRLLRTTVFSLLSGLFAILSTLLITTVVFGHVSLIALPANLLLSPLFSLALAIGPLLLLIPTLFGPVAEGISALILGGTELTSGIRGVYAVARYPLFSAALLLFTIYWGLLLIRKIRSRRGFLVRFLAAAAALCAVFLICHIPSQYRSFILIARRASEDYLVLRQDNRVTVVANACSASPSTLLQRLEERGINEIDALILTHETGQEEALLTALSRAVVVRKVILPYGEESEAAPLLYITEELGITVSRAAGPTVSENGLTVKLLPTGKTAHTGLLLSIDHKAGRIVYASPSALAAVNAEARHRFLEGAELLYLGAHPNSESREVPLPLPDGCRLLTAYTKLLPSELLARAEELTAYGSFYMPLS